MPRKKRYIINNNNNSDEEQEEEPNKEQPIYFKSKYKEHQTLKINEATNNFLKCNIINFNSF
jgi:hypothetical protein